MKKLFASLIFGLLVLGLAPFGIMNTYAATPLYGLAHNGGNGPSTFYTINTSNGVATPVGAVGFEGCSGMDVDSSGTVYATCARPGTQDSVLVTINPNNGVGTEVGLTGVLPGGGGNSAIKDISFRNSDGVLFGYEHDCGGVGSLMTIDLTSGAATLIPTNGQCIGGVGLAFVGNVLKVSLGGSLWDVNQVNAALSNPIASSTFPAMDFNPNDGLLYAVDRFGAGPWDLVTVNTATGAVTNIGPTVNGLTAIAFSDSVVGGEFLQIDSVTLILAGLQTSAVWMLPIVAGAVGTTAFYLKMRKN